MSISNKVLKYFLNHTKTFEGKWHQNETPPVYSYWTKALSCKFSEWCNIVHTTFWAPKLPEKIIFFNLGATLDLPMINMKNQNKPNVCQSLVLQVYFKKNVLWIAGFYLFGFYNNNNFGPTHYISHFFSCFQNPTWQIWQILKICKNQKFEIFLEEYHNINFQTPSKSRFFKKGLWKCHFFAKCVFCNFKATLSETLNWHKLRMDWN